MVGQGARLSRMFMVMGAEVMSRRACEWGALFLGSRRCMTDIVRLEGRAELVGRSYRALGLAMGFQPG